jgi:redox-sensitive bicupin YhaK (pirin superfamily)
MTAGSGLIHEEKHSAKYAKSGGPFEMVQLWVNLPAKHKMVAPRYQSLLDADFPRATLPAGAGYLRVIAGQYLDHQGPAMTYSPISLWDVVLKEGGSCQLQAPAQQTLALFILSGEVEVCKEETFGACTLVILDPDDPEFTLHASKSTKILVLSGQAFAEPIVGYGPFVMNTAEEIKQAISDYQSGKMGALRVES